MQYHILGTASNRLSNGVDVAKCENATRLSFVKKRE
jgi:hypothetical protein